MSPTKQTCYACKRSQKAGWIKKIDCRGIDYVDECKHPTEKIPKLSEDNRKFWNLFIKILPGLCRFDNSFSYNSIDSVFRTWGVKEGQRPVLLDRCLIVIGVIQETRRVERAKHGS